MAIVEIEKPQIVTFSYRQTRDDADYGSCMWARFHFDTVAYTMFIESDCGSYSYGWVPTPKSESFLHLMARCEGEYILGKISSMSKVDIDGTFTNLVELLSDEEYDEGQWRCIRDSIDQPCAEMIAQEVLDSIPFHTTCMPKESDIYECIQYDYPARAKKIAEIFEKHIVPAIRKMGK